MKNWKDKITFTNNNIYVVVTLLLTAFVIFGATLSNVYTETYEIERFGQAQETIRSPITIEDTRETERRQRDAVQSVEDRYVILHNISIEQLDLIDEVFEAIEVVNEPVEIDFIDGENQEEADDANDSPVEEDETDDEDLIEEDREPVFVERSSSEKVQLLEQMLSQTLYQSLSEDEWLTLIQMSTVEKSSSSTLMSTILNELFNEGITRDELAEAEAALAQRLNFSSLSQELTDALISLGQYTLVENSFFSMEETLTAERQALQNVEPQMIRAGEVIVSEGQTITNEIYDTLSLVGLLSSDRNVFPVIGLVIITLLLTVLLAYSYVQYLTEDQRKLKQMTALLVITVSTILIMKFVSFFYTDTNILYLLTPVAASSMLLKLLFRERIAILYTLIFTVLATIIFNREIPGALNIEAGIYVLFTQISSIAALRKTQDRLLVFKAVLITGIVNVLIVLSFIFLSYESYQWMDMLVFGGYGFAASIISGVVTIGSLPFFESILGMLSDTKLLTLASPNHPLLKKILTEAPGTYHHSVMVANLSEAACEAIGANGLLARVASYFHDIGKTKNPHYFIENQMGIRNPHDFLSPLQSATIILSHPLDGSRILKEHKLPKEIIDIAEQHHGTSLVKYFYFQAKKEFPDIDQDKFRYPGPKPNTRESAVISICDSVEAAVRSMDDPTREKIDRLIDQIIQDRLMDGQFDESSITFKEISKVRETLSESLNGIYHQRIQYPEDTNKEKKE